MDIQIHGKQIDLGEALSEHASSRLQEAVVKYSENPIDAQIFYSKDGHEFLCDVIVHLSTGLRTKARGRASEIYASTDDAIERVQKQLRRYKRKLKNHHNERSDLIETFSESSYIIEASRSDSEAEEQELQPVIVAETQTKVQTVSVGEAVLQMELAGEDFLVFRNSKHGGVNVVHRREDGNIGWIDPRRDAV